jgi:plasmid stabilization system protein ParE
MSHILSIALVLQLHNFAGAPPAIVDKAERELTRVYDDIGVHVEWDRARDRHADARAVIRIILVAHESGDLRRTPHTVMGATMWTDHGTPAVYVFYRRVEAEAERHAVSIALVLACALAHEVGHVLMPEGAHSREGLMRACWNGDDFHSADRGQLRFIPEQVALMRHAAIAPRDQATETQRH